MLYDGYGNIVSIGGASGVSDTFFNITKAKHTNLCDPDAMTEDVRMNNYGNWNNTMASSGACITDKIPCTPGKYIYAGHASKNVLNAPEAVSYTSHMSVNRVNFYTQEGNFVSCVESETSPVLVPDNAAFVIVSYPYQFLLYDNDKSRCFVTIKDTNTDESFEFEPYTKEDVLDAKIKKANLSYTELPIPHGKTWLLFGDSLTDSYGGHSWDESTSPVGGDGWKDTTDRVPWTGHFWASKIARELGLTIDNRAKSGSNINIGNNGNYADVCGINILNAFLDEIDAGSEAPDFITVGFGSNAIMSQLGTSEDTSETTSSVCGAVKYFIEQLRTKCPNAAIGFVLPPQSDWGDTSTVKSVEQGRTAIKSVLDLDEYAVPYVDMWKESGITVDMLPDGIHVSSKQANNLYYHAMRRFMMGL